VIPVLDCVEVLAGSDDLQLAVFVLQSHLDDFDGADRVALVLFIFCLNYKRSYFVDLPEAAFAY
jgi:hypothetical protein